MRFGSVGGARTAGPAAASGGDDADGGRAGLGPRAGPGPDGAVRVVGLAWRALAVLPPAAVAPLAHLAPSGGGVELKASHGMEVLVGGKWLIVPVTGNTRDAVRIGPVPATATRPRYNWYCNPFGIECFGRAVYAKGAPPGTLSRGPL